MKRLFILGAISSLMVTMLSFSWAATNLDSSRGNIYAMSSQKKPPETTTINLNSSKSNIYRMVYDANIVSQA